MDLSYDANGNIKTLSRKQNGTHYDNLTYLYNKDANTQDLKSNRLYHINDAGTSIGTDIADQGTAPTDLSTKSGRDAANYGYTN